MKDLEDKLEDLTLASSDIDANWCAIRDVMYSTAMEHIVPSVRKHQDWFDQNNTEIQALLAEKDAYTSTRRKVQTKLREMQNAWYSKKVKEIQHYAVTNNTQRFYNARLFRLLLLGGVTGPNS